MNLIYFSRRRGEVRQISLANRSTLALGAVLALVATGSLFYGGVRVGMNYGTADPTLHVEAWQAELDSQAVAIAEARAAAEESIDALALRLGQMNAHVIRLDALGHRLTEMAGLEDGEFDFSSTPPLGGPEEPLLGGTAAQLGELLKTIDGLQEQVRDREKQLGVLRDMLLSRNLREQVHPEGRPVVGGWVSSFFGKRTDPFTGKQAFHKGIDIAGRKGMDVVAVAAGVVTYSGERYGYGRMVEINHGNGYVTRYAHNEENLVEVGQAVKKGQLIGKMGATGRATGPNLHFEVLRNGQVVNPMTYIRESS
jgi:murein DD-endopeptidase MepM/ murein hydrolase activator NlpD